MAEGPFFKRIIMKNIVEKTKQFLREVFAELKKVNWLSRKEAVKYTIFVLAATVLMAAFLGGLDYLFSVALKMFILK